jgi:hypothetical protein
VFDFIVGEQWWSFNGDINKRRSVEEYEDLAEAVRLIVGDKEADMIWQGFNSTLLLFSNSTKKSYPNITPKAFHTKEDNDKLYVLQRALIDINNADSEELLNNEHPLGSRCTGFLQLPLLLKEHNHVKTHPEEFVSNYKQYKQRYEGMCSTELSQMTQEKKKELLARVDVYRVGGLKVEDSNSMKGISDKNISHPSMSMQSTIDRTSDPGKESSEIEQFESSVEDILLKLFTKDEIYSYMSYSFIVSFLLSAIVMSVLMITLKSKITDVITEEI